MPGLTGTRFYSAGVRNAAHSLSASRHRPSRRCWGWGLRRTYRLRSPLSRCSGSFRSGRRIRRTAGKPHCTGTLLCRGALSRRRYRLAAFCRSASGLHTLRHGDVILFSRRYAAVRAALIDPLGRNGGETGSPCRTGGAAMVRRRARSKPPCSCRAGAHTGNTHNAACSCCAVLPFEGPLTRCALPSVSGLGYGRSCHAGPSGGWDMRCATVCSRGDGCFPCGIALIGRCALCPAVHAVHRTGNPCALWSSHALLPGVHVLAAKLHRTPLGGPGLRGIARRLGCGTSWRGAGLLAAGGVCTCRTACRSCRAGKARPTGNRACPGSVRPTAARRRCTAAMTSASGILSC